VQGTETAAAWADFKANNPKAKMVCIDLQPGTTTQVQTDSRVLNVGGFSDAVYDVIANFASQSADKDFWVKQIEG
jgi:60 kDa SS-A/Ro ribonucleoprotein